MGSNPINLALRFVLEILALIAAGKWGWHQSEGWLRYALAIGIPIVLAVIWGTFAVPDDPSRSGMAPVPTPGMIRFFIEIAIFGFATWVIIDMGFSRTGLVFGIIILLHYLISYDRIQWLLAN